MDGHSFEYLPMGILSQLDLEPPSSLEFKEIPDPNLRILQPIQVILRRQLYCCSWTIPDLGFRQCFHWRRNGQETDADDDVRAMIGASIVREFRKIQELAPRTRFDAGMHEKWSECIQDTAKGK